MRIAISSQARLDCQTIDKVQLNLNCRDEIVPILRALQHLYSQKEPRDEILRLIAEDVNEDSRDDCGREGMSYWEILVLAAVRLGCNLDYDKLQDLAEQHRALRQIMGIGDWDEKVNFNWRRIHDNLCLLKPQTIEKLSHLIVGEGHRLDPEAAKKVRADSFVVETNIHYPTESSLILDGVRLILGLCVAMATRHGLKGWRQHEHLLEQVRRLARDIQRISSRKGPGYQERLQEKYRRLLKRTRKILRRAEQLHDRLTEQGADEATLAKLAQLKAYLQLTEQVCQTAQRRVMEGEKVPNEDKVFSLFETHTQLYKRGKAGEPVQFGRLVLIYEDAAGFVVHHHVLPRDAQDQDVVVEQTRQVQDRLGGRIEHASFDRGFHSPLNQTLLADILDHPCLPKPGARQSAAQLCGASVEFHQARQRHPGVESAIGALQSGNGLERCRDRSELGFERYVALGILGRNLHTLGKMLIAREHAHCAAAESRRKHTAA
jgi:hypothetical protein